MAQYTWDQLRQMATRKELRPDQMLYDQRYGWVRADAIPELRSAFAPQDWRPLLGLLAGGAAALLALRGLENSRLAKLSWEDLRLGIFRRDKWTCTYCGHRGTSTTLEVDHKLPIARGGTDDPANLVTACWSCNRAKGTMTASEFRWHRIWST